MKIIQFKERKVPVEDLDLMLKNAVDLNEHLKTVDQEPASINFKNLIQSKIMEIMISVRLTDCGEVLCGIYVAELLNQLVTWVPDSWFATDHWIKGHESENMASVKNGADICLLLCALFTARTQRRAMSYKDYRHLGIAMYWQFYLKTRQEIAKHMANRFDRMAYVAHRCIKEI